MWQFGMLYRATRTQLRDSVGSSGIRLSQATCRGDSLGFLVIRMRVRSLQRMGMTSWD